MMRATSAAALLLVALAAAALSGKETAAPERGGYAGPESCRPCHVELYDRWATSAHARSTERATAENLPPEVLEQAAIDHAPGSSAFRREGDRFLVETVGPDGKPHAYPVTHVVGPRRISMFLTRMGDGRLQVLPFMREVPTGKYFDYTHLIFGVAGKPFEKPPEVKPGEPSFWTGPIRAYDRSCGRCHTSGRREGGEWDPLPVDCEACHGPCADHVAFWKSPPDRHTKDPVLVLSELGRERAQGLCLWCHMEADVVDEGYRPGDDVFEHLSPTLLDNIERIDAAGRPLELIYDGLPFLFSPCAQRSGLTCLTCHDAHGGPFRSDLLVPEERTFTLCNGCHLDIAADPVRHTFHDPKGSGGRCVACHMPFLTIERGHGIVRDHTIGSPLLDLYGGRVAKDACTWCHTRSRGAPEDAPVLEAPAIDAAYRRWYPGAKLRPRWVAAIAGAREGRADSFFPLVEAAGSIDSPRMVRASAARLLGKHPQRALPYLIRLVEDGDSLVRRSATFALGSIRHEDSDDSLLSALADPSAAVRQSAARAALRGWDRVTANRDLLRAALPVLLEEAEAVPLDDRRWFRLGAAREIAGDVKGAIEAYERKLELDPYARLVRRAVEELKRR
ncbi:MAG: HEAT repeat domain-containing protein [Planctomycetota bacterium]|jgi:predicted CXXCH cytochrome family protein